LNRLNWQPQEAATAVLAVPGPREIQVEAVDLAELAIRAVATAAGVATAAVVALAATAARVPGGHLLAWFSLAIQVRRLIASTFLSARPVLALSAHQHIRPERHTTKKPRLGGVSFCS
jgi:hypothetical protein